MSNNKKIIKEKIENEIETFLRFMRSIYPDFTAVVLFHIEIFGSSQSLMSNKDEAGIVNSVGNALAKAGVNLDKESKKLVLEMIEQHWSQNDDE